MKRDVILYLLLSTNADATDRLLELVSGLDRARILPIVIVGSNVPAIETFRNLGVETHLEPVCACFLNACRQTPPSRFLFRPGLMYALFSYCVRLSRFIRERKIDAVSGHSFKTRLIGGFAARLAGVPVVRPALQEPMMTPQHG